MRSTNYKIPWVLAVGAAGILYVLVSKSPESSVANAPCSDQAVFSIDTIDSRFGISKERVKQAFEEGVEAWETAAGKPLAVYQEEGGIPIRLIYDDRQKLVDGEFTFREQIRSEELRIEALEQEFRQDSTRYEERLADYERSVEYAEKKIDSLNEWVEEKNNSSGLQETEVVVFEQRREEIDRLEQQLVREDRELKFFARQLNEKIDRLNRMINEKNEMVSRYNETYPGERRFAQGTYARSGNQQAISIHQFSGVDELRLVLAHELGHALGLYHVENPQSVMYPEMTSQPRSVLQLTDEDRAAIRSLCGG